MSHRRVVTGPIRFETQDPSAQFHMIFNPRSYYSWVVVDHFLGNGMVNRFHYPRLNHQTGKAEPYI